MSIVIYYYSYYYHSCNHKWTYLLLIMLTEKHACMHACLPHRAETYTVTTMMTIASTTKEKLPQGQAQKQAKT